MKNILCIIGWHKPKNATLVAEVNEFGSICIDGDVCERCGFVSEEHLLGARQLFHMSNCFRSPLKKRLDVHVAVVGKL